LNSLVSNSLKLKSFWHCSF